MSLSYSHDHLGSVWYHSESSEGPYFSKPVTGQELFLAVSYSRVFMKEKFDAYVMRTLAKKVQNLIVCKAWVNCSQLFSILLDIFT